VKLDVANIATILVLIYAVVGAALVVLSAITHVDPKLALSFSEYLKQMAVATAGLAVGRGLAARKR
jgi:hypothetical protein